MLSVVSHQGILHCLESGHSALCVADVACTVCVCVCVLLHYVTFIISLRTCLCTKIEHFSCSRVDELI